MAETVFDGNPTTDRDRAFILVKDGNLRIIRPSIDTGAYEENFKIGS